MPGKPALDMKKDVFSDLLISPIAEMIGIHKDLVLFVKTVKHSRQIDKLVIFTLQVHQIFGEKTIAQPEIVLNLQTAFFTAAQFLSLIHI